ncbi:unnamed protein product [marine sediment metagenome]|uniref:Uncharacterized protein n=1 Tax=marine sediment metagenome TaxID=412755 RepID=X1TI38_9ZZZZ
MTSIHRFTHGAFPDILTDAGFTNINVDDISQNVWPTWHWLFDEAVEGVWPLIRRGDNPFENTNLLASLMIWPNREKFRYNVITATNP